MTIVKDKRAQIVWVLFTCILLNAFVCSLNHASHVGFELAMGQDAFCFTDGTSSGGKTPAAGAHDAPNRLSTARCAVRCSSPSSCCWPWAGWAGGRGPLARPRDDLRGPRQQCPALNPQAP